MKLSELKPADYNPLRVADATTFIQPLSLQAIEAMAQRFPQVPIVVFIMRPEIWERLKKLCGSRVVRYPEPSLTGVSVFVFKNDAEREELIDSLHKAGKRVHEVK